MEEYLNSKEKALLEYICTRYKNTLDVKFRIPANNYEKIGVKDSDELGKLLMALSIRNYIYLDSAREMHTLWSSELKLTEKALNCFNAKREEE